MRVTGRDAGFALRIRAVLLLLLASPGLLGCSAIGYYSQALTGHWQVMAAREPIPEVIADPATPPAVADKLRLVERLREFAHQQLLLPDNGSYEDYADIGRPHVVWNVFATPEFSLDPVQSCFPLIGCVSYRGYYAEEDARAWANSLAAQGNDVFVGGVAAYSTLGWFDDPVLNTMLRWDDQRLAAVLFHEMAHAVVYARNDTEFNESFATAVQREGVRRWAQMQDSADWEQRLSAEDAERAWVLARIAITRSELETLYGGPATDDEKRRSKQLLLSRLSEDYLQRYGSDGDHAGWFSGELNNARLAAISDYQGQVGAFENLLQGAGGNLSCFYDEVRRVAALPEEARADWVQAWGLGQNSTLTCPG